MIQPRMERKSGGDVFSYARHRPEQTLLYQLIERHWPDFQSHLIEAGSFLPRHVAREFDEYLECGRLEHGFLRVRVKIATTSIWWPSAVNAEVFAPVVVQGVWRKPPHCWWMMSYLTNPSVNGCSVFPIHYDSYWPATRRLSLKYWAL